MDSNPEVDGSDEPPSPGDTGLDRRQFLRGTTVTTLGLAVGALPLTPRQEAGGSSKLRVAVVGAGAFGGWTALSLLDRGARVTLVDAWGPGNSRASSGGETRVIRGMYGPDDIYVDWVLHSFERWQRAAARWEEPLYTPTGALWMFRGDDGYARSSIPLLAERGVTVERIEVDDARRRFPEIDFDGVRSVYHEPKAGFLAARRACRAIVDAFVAGGGEYRLAAARPTPIEGGGMKRLALADGTSITADRYVFACGPWLPELFPDLLGEALVPSRQEVYFFGAAAGSDAFDVGRLPVWIDFGERIYYGVPGNMERGFKVADDTHGEPVDPTTMERTPSAAGLRRARRLLDERFPNLADAPLVDARVCQYTNSPDGDLVLDRHPDAENVWIAGGGSGHGFKLGPAVGEHVADLVLGEVEPVGMFSIERLAGLEGKGRGESQLHRGESDDG